MIGKLHYQSGINILAICDKDLINKKLITDSFEIVISPAFFGEHPILEKDILELIDNCDSANIFGKKICNFLLKNNLILKEQIIHIDSVPHVQLYKI